MLKCVGLKEIKMRIYTMLCYCCTNSGISSSRLTSYLNAYFSPCACIGQTVSQIQFLKLTESTEKNFFYYFYFLK